MDQIFVGLYHRLYDFVMKYFETYAMKSVTLGHDSHQASAQLPSPGAASAVSSSITDQATHPVAEETPVEDASLQTNVEPDSISEGGIASATSNEEAKEDVEGEMSVIGREAQPPKKTVSINDTIEEMTATISKKKKRTEKMGSFDQEIEELKPLKSILKVGSKID